MSHIPIAILRTVFQSSPRAIGIQEEVIELLLYFPSSLDLFLYLPFLLELGCRDYCFSLSDHGLHRSHRVEACHLVTFQCLFFAVFLTPDANDDHTVARIEAARLECRPRRRGERERESMCVCES